MDKRVGEGVMSVWGVRGMGVRGVGRGGGCERWCCVNGGSEECVMWWNGRY